LSDNNTEKNEMGKYFAPCLASNAGSEVKDGMDISLLCVNLKNKNIF
jgi:hypothetical protein